ncbi:MAG: dihydrofolate reductase family protein [Gemmatimonadota bacterium]|nr:dihydrofolate reductase family protein [Gemmatimonadota bacterium]
MTADASALDAERAWAHLLELEPGSSGPAGPLTVSADGRWRSSVEATDEAKTMLDVFAPLRVRARFVIGQLGQSLDGRIATTSGHSHYVNGPEDIVRLHRLRALVQAVVVGAGTVDADDPQLTVRHVDGANPLRVVLDPNARLDARRNVFRDRLSRTLWVIAEGATSASTTPEEPFGHSAFVERVALPCGVDGFEPDDILEMLRQRDVHRVLVEGGGVTVSRFLAAGALDRLHVSVAPLLIGSGRSSITLPAVETLDEALRPSVRHFLFGRDLLFDLELHPRGQ